MGGVGSIVYTTRGGGEGDGGRSNDGGGLRPAEPRKREYRGRKKGRWYGFMPIKCIVTGPKVQENSGTSEMAWENKIRLRKR